MKRHLLFFSIAILFALISCQSKKDKMQNEEIPEYPVLVVRAGNYEILKCYPTAIEGILNIKIRAKNSAYINRVLVDEGQEVFKDMPLFELETKVLHQEAEAANAQVDAAKIELAKLQPLFQKGIVSNFQVETAEASLKEAQSRHASILANIDYAYLKSPTNGVIGAIDLRQGSLVSPSTISPLTSVSHIDSIYAYFSMNEKDFIDFSQKMISNKPSEKLMYFPAVRLLLANDSLFPFKGRIEAFSGQVKKNTGSVRFRAIFPNPDWILRDGSSGVIQIPQLYKNVVAIPEMCTFEMQGKTLVFIVNKDNILETRSIKPLGLSGKYLLVKNNLKAGEIILARGINKVRGGMKISPKPTSNQELTDSFQPYFPSL